MLATPHTNYDPVQVLLLCIGYLEAKHLERVLSSLECRSLSARLPKGPCMRLIATLLISGELIVSKYVAESITMIAGRFGHEGLCQLRTELFCTQLTKAFVAETSCNHCY